MGKDCNRRGFRSTNFLYVVILCLLLSPATGFAQTKRINLELKNVTVQEAVTSLNRTENYSILVSSDEVDLNKRISVSAQNATIRRILDQVFAGQEVNCTINGNRIIVTKRQSRAHGRNADRPGRLRIRPSDRHQRTADYRCDGHDRRIPKRHTDRSRRDFRIDGGDLSRPTQHLLSGLHHTNRNNRARGGESSAQHRPERV